jgi:hypothetical protein
MNKKAAPLVAAFLLLGGAFKMGSNASNVKGVRNYLFGVMMASDILNCLFGLRIGFLASKY